MSSDAFQPADFKVLSDLAQIKILADPLRVRMLELLCRDEMTTKQVADSLGEKPTKLYHHVEALERAGLVRLTRTRQNRGTLEKYYRAVALGFTVEAGLFEPESGAAAESPLPEMVASVLERTRGELTALMSSDAAGEIESSALITFCEIQASEQKLEKFRARLEEVVREMGEEDGEVAESGAERRYRLTLAFFPLDRS